MKLIILIKGEDDFGRRFIGNDKAAFDIVGYERPDVGSFILCIYPQDNTHLFHEVISLTTCIEKDYPFCYSGVMRKANLISWFDALPIEDKYKSNAKFQERNIFQNEKQTT